MLFKFCVLRSYVKKKFTLENGWVGEWHPLPLLCLQPCSNSYANNSGSGSNNNNSNSNNRSNNCNNHCTKDGIFH